LDSESKKFSLALPPRSDLTVEKVVKAVDSSYRDVISHLLQYVKEVYPGAVTQIMMSATTQEAKDFMLRTISNTVRQVLRFLTRKDSMDLWQKLHSIFQLKFEVNEGSKQAEPLSVSDI
jgi:hypothetical protein